MKAQCQRDAVGVEKASSGDTTTGAAAILRAQRQRVRSQRGREAVPVLSGEVERRAQYARLQQTRMQDLELLPAVSDLPYIFNILHYLALQTFTVMP